MKPIAFPEMTVTYAQNQPEYLPLPAYANEHESISLWALTWRERLTVLVTGKLWFRQCNFGQPLQPQLPQVRSPFRLANGDNGSVITRWRNLSHYLERGSR